MLCQRLRPPSEIEIEQLLAGEGTPELELHVRECPACRQRAYRLQRDDLLLKRLLFRATCPEPEVLGECLLGWLEEEEAAGVQAHLEQCPYCRQDIAGLKQVLELPLRELDSVGAPLRRLVARLVTPRALDPANSYPAVQLRGQQPGTRQYRIENITITVDIECQPDRLYQVAGLLVSDANAIGQFEAATAHLKLGHQEVATARVDDLDTFVFAGVPKGEYTLEIASKSAVVVIERVVVG